MIQRVLISVSDKTGIQEFASFLQKRGVEILSTGGTAAKLREHGIPVIEVADYTGSPEIFGGRVKTLHPRIHGGILYLRGNEEHEEAAGENDILPIDLVVVNLYPFEKTVRSPDVTQEEAIENIDIGGPGMLRAAAKNYEHVTAVIDPSDYPLVQAEIENEGNTTMETRKHLAAKVFSKTAQYDGEVARYFSADFFAVAVEKVQDLRYGENPHQSATFYQMANPFAPSLATAEILQGKELSYNNILDANAALSLILEFADGKPAACIIKHLNPCGAASSKTLHKAFENAYSGDPMSAFGGIVALNGEVDGKLATRLSEVFLEVILAPIFSAEARKILSKKQNLRLLEVGKLRRPLREKDVRSVLGGFLVQDLDVREIHASDLEQATKKKPTPKQIEELLFAWKICRHVKSNAILIAQDKTAIGIGAGQMSRVDSVEIALKKAGKRIKNAVAASDAYFPFPDGVEFLGKAGIKAIIQPGGSIRDSEVIAKCDELGIAMVFTKIRAFRH